MTHIDDAIRRALSPADLAAYEALAREPSPIAEAFGMFQNQRRGYVFMVALAGAALVALGAYAAWRLMKAAETREMFGWSLLATFAMLALLLIKLWFWLEMQRNSVVREVKRLELQVAALAAARQA
jgi:hypothetical protein